MLYSLNRYLHDINLTTNVACLILKTKPNYRSLPSAMFLLSRKKDVTYFPHVENEEKATPFYIENDCPIRFSLSALFLSLGTINEE